MEKSTARKTITGPTPFDQEFFDQQSERLKRIMKGEAAGFFISAETVEVPTGWQVDASCQVVNTTKKVILGTVMDALKMTPSDLLAYIVETQRHSKGECGCGENCKASATVKKI